VLGNRRSSIYKNRPPFSIFGIGEYSFANWKVAISGLYKKMVFSVVPPINGKPTMLDDTCYFIPCGSSDEAQLICDMLSSSLAQKIIGSMVFLDAKRPITTEILRRISLYDLAVKLGRLDELSNVSPKNDCSKPLQALLPFG
jgi:hypothetical protein